MIHRLKSLAANSFPSTATYTGSRGDAWFAGGNARAPSIAATFCGDDTRLTARTHIRRGRIGAVAIERAARGALVVVRDVTRDAVGRVQHALESPVVIHQYVQLPDTIGQLHEQVRTSTTREDLRRIRKANFTYRISTDPAAVDEFYHRHYLPLLTERYPDDASISDPDDLKKWLQQGGELVCAEKDGEWIAGFFNVCHNDRYALNWMGVRDGDRTIRNSHVIAALYVRSMGRGVELGKSKATFGRSLPFLGKGLVWFKAKWGGIIARDPKQRATMGIFADLRHASVRRMLAETPLIISEDETEHLAACCWLTPGEKSLRQICRDCSRFPGINRWFVFANAQTLEAGKDSLSKCEMIVPVAVADPGTSPVPCWLGELVHQR